MNMLDIAGRRKACEDTINRTPSIAASIAADGGNPLESTFIPTQLSPLEKSSPMYPALTRQPVQIYDSDAFGLARILDPTVSTLNFTQDPQSLKRGKVGVLNLASDREPGGGWRYTLSKTQEEALCYSSTLYATLNPEWYPFPNTGPGSCAGIVSPGVVVFKDTLDQGLVDLPIEQRHEVVVVTVAAPCRPQLTANGEGFADASELHDLQEKILLILRLAAVQGVTRLVLGAMGCGAYGCPPRAVAQEMKTALEREEFLGWFEIIAFAVHASGPSGKQNLDTFGEVFNET